MTRRCTSGSDALHLLVLIDFRERLSRHPEGIDAGRHAAVDRDLHEDLADLVARHAVHERTLDVHLQLVRPVERADHRQVEHAARLARQCFASPDVAPAVLRDQFLHRTVEIVGALEGVLDELGSERVLANLQSLVERRLVHRRYPLISTPAHSSTTRAMLVKSELAPNLAWVTASICRIAAPATIGTPSASASSTHSRTSL